MAVTEPASPQGAAAPSRPRRTAGVRSREATRARLLDSGLALIAERGLHNVTTHDVARSAGVAAGTFYLHFKDKRALFSELAHEASAALRTRVAKAVDAVPGDDGEAVVRAHAEALLAFADDNREFIHLLFSTDSDAASVGADILNELAEAISSARSEKGLVPPGCDATVLSQAVVGMLARVVAWWAEGNQDIARESVVETLVHIQLSGTRPG